MTAARVVCWADRDAQACARAPSAALPVAVRAQEHVLLAECRRLVRLLLVVKLLLVAKVVAAVPADVQAQPESL